MALTTEELEQTGRVTRLLGKLDGYLRELYQSLGQPADRTVHVQMTRGFLQSLKTEGEEFSRVTQKDLWQNWRARARARAQSAIDLQSEMTDEYVDRGVLARVFDPETLGETLRETGEDLAEVGAKGYVFLKWAAGIGLGLLALLVLLKLLKG